MALMRSETSLHGFLFESAADAQQAFYEAFQRCDIEDMMAVWADDESILCVHPGGPRLYGPDAVRESWEQIFKESPGGWDFHLVNGQCIEDELLSVHQLQENLYDRGRLQGSVIATNVYHHTSQGWRMALHHASPVPETAESSIALGRNLH